MFFIEKNEKPKVSSHCTSNVFLFWRYLYHGNTNAELAFESAKILCCISCNSNIQIKLVGDFTHDQVTDFVVVNFWYVLNTYGSHSIYEGILLLCVKKFSENKYVYCRMSRKPIHVLGCDCIWRQYHSLNTTYALVYDYTVYTIVSVRTDGTCSSKHTAAVRFVSTASVLHPCFTLCPLPVFWVSLCNSECVSNCCEFSTSVAF